MAATERGGRKLNPNWDQNSTFTLRLDTNLQRAFDQVVSEQGQTKSQRIREFMLQTVQAAGRSDLLKN